MKQTAVFPIARWTLAWIAGAWLIAGCASSPPPRPTRWPVRPGVSQRPPAVRLPKNAPATQRPYKVNGRWYYPVPSAEGYTETGIASWYGPKFHGRPTASGETYNMNALTAAHKELPLGTLVRVRNLDNGRTAEVRINDRGPFVSGRIIDLSYGAAKRLGVVGPGTARVRITALATSRPTPPASPGRKAPSWDSGRYTFQVGAFKNPQNAYRLRKRLSRRYQNAHVTAYDNDSLGRLYGVRIGLATTLKQAAQYKATLRQHGFPGAFTIAE